jgi:PAS domain S-box-containing protein
MASSHAYQLPHKDSAALELLRVSEERFRILMETITAGAFVWDGEKTVYVNAAASRMTGYTRDELRKLDPWQLVHPDSLPGVLEIREQNLRGEPISLQHELKMVRKDGATLWILLSIDWVHITETESLMIGTATDITERKLAEEALQHSEARYRLLYQDNPSMYFTVDPDGTVLDVNDFGASQLGYTPGDLIGRPVLDVFHREDRAAVTEHMQDLLRAEGETRVWEFRKVCRDGRVIWVEEVARVTRDEDGNQVLLIVCEDITERRRMEDDLKENEARLRAFANAMPDVTLILDEDGRYVDILGSAENSQMLYAPPEQLKGQLMHDILPKANADAFLAVIRKTISSGKPQTIEYSLNVQKGSEWFEARTAPLQAPGARAMVIWTARNITQRKRLEEELVAVREEIDRRAERVAARGSVYGLSFREVAVLQLVVEGRSDKEVASILGITRMTASKHVARILRKLKASSRTEAGVRAVREGLIG